MVPRLLQLMEPRLVAVAHHKTKEPRVESKIRSSRTLPRPYCLCSFLTRALSTMSRQTMVPRLLHLMEPRLVAVAPHKTLFSTWSLPNSLLGQ
ncbi:unnamed protein product [Cochlearia groenlandica]